MGALARLIAAVIGESLDLPPGLLRLYPELTIARYRRGGIFLRIGGWALGAASVSGVTLGHTIWIARNVALDPELLLHEVRHVQQFQAGRAFAARYAWETLRRGYYSNRFEVDARDYAARRALRGGEPPPSPGA